MAKHARTIQPRYLLGATLAIAAGVFLVVALTGEQYYFSLHPARFLAIHVLAELFTILVAFSVFAVGWYTPSEDTDPRLRPLSAAFLAVALLDLFHTLSYSLMSGLLLQPSPNQTTSFWLAARGMAALGLLVAALPRRWLKRLPDLLFYSVALALTAAATWVIAQGAAWLPVMFVPGKGVTEAKVLAEGIIIAAMIPAAVRFYAESHRTRSLPATHFVQAIIFLVFGELAFTIYRNVFDIYNLLGHLFKVLGYFYIFQAVYVANVRRPYEDLQRLVAERTAELERALAELKEVDRLKDEFVSGLSHDLRQPLVPIKGFLDMLLAGRVGPLAGKQAEFLRHCRGAVQRQGELIDEMLDYARLRAGRLNLELEVLDLREVLQEALKMLESVAMQQKLRVEADMGAEPLLVEADRTKILRVFNNLFSNAVKFSSKQGLIRVEARKVDGEAAVSVEDTGRGIQAEERERVFERFYQAGGGSRSGAGIGLWVVREIMRLHGGRVELESEPGKGSRFTVLMALARKDNEAARPDTP